MAGLHATPHLLPACLLPQTMSQYPPPHLLLFSKTNSLFLLPLSICCYFTLALYSTNEGKLSMSVSLHMTHFTQQDSLQSICVAANSMISIFFIVKQYTMMSMYHGFFI